VAKVWIRRKSLSSASTTKRPDAASPSVAAGLAALLAKSASEKI